MGLPRKYWRKMMMKKLKKKKTGTTTTTTKDIPNDVMVEILSRLPVHSLLRFKRVCKSWFNLITDPNFVYMQLNSNVNHIHTSNNNHPLVLIYSNHTSNHNLQLHSYNIMEDDKDHTLHSSRLVKAKVPSITSSLHSFKILGSCNGLLCIVVSTSDHRRRDRFFIWNPCTKEYKKVTDAPSGINGYSKYGFGYDYTMDDYKLVKNTCHGRRHDNPETCVYVYGLGASSWKTLSCYPFKFSSTEEDNGLFINGHLYYTAKKMSRPFDIIVSFDIAKEEYQQIAMPVIYKGAYAFSVKLGELKGCLCLISIEFDRREFPEVWVMKHSFNDIHMKEEYSWEKLYTISTQEKLRSLSIKPLRFCKNGEMAMLMDGKEIVLYDPKSNKITSLRKVSKEEKVETYRESLVSLNSGTYMSQLCKHARKPLDFRLVSRPKVKTE